MSQDLMEKARFSRHFFSVFFSSRKAALISSLFCIAVTALLYISSMQMKDAAHIELPTGPVERTITEASTTQFSASQEILILNSYHSGHAWSDNEMAGIVEIIHETAPSVSYSIEYLDCKRHPQYEHFEQIVELFKIKYGNRVIPLVIIADNPALEFALKYRSLLFPKSAIVFCGVNNFKHEMLGNEKNITGLAEALNAVDTVSLALRLHPKTKTVVIVHDYTATGLATRREAEEQIKGKFGGVSFRYLEDMNKADLTQLLKGLPEDNLVLGLAYNVFKDGELITHGDFAQLLSANTSVPVYGVHQERLGNGIVGGHLLSGKLHGAEAGRVALKILSGMQASDIPVEITSKTRIMFDYNQLVRFGIPLKALPEGSVIVNRPIPFIASHLDLVVSTLLVIGLLTSGIFILGFNIYRRHLVEEALRTNKEELEMRVSERTVELEKANDQLHIELTEREKTELRRRASEQAFRAVVENSPDIIVRYDRDGRLILVNQEFERVNRLTVKEVLGKKPIEISTELAPMVDVFTEKLMAAMASGTVTKIDISFTKEGKPICWFVRVIPEFDTDGKVVSALTIWSDISERKQTEEEVRKLNEELEQRVRERTKELEQTNHELQQMNKAFVGRELRMMELKERIKELENTISKSL